MKLNEFILGLSQAEKRYFSRLSAFQKLSETNYLKLFLSYKKGEGEAVIKKKLGVNYFTQLKQQLKIKILESLRLFHRKSFPFNQEDELVKNAFILKSRGYWEEAYSDLLKAKNSVTEKSNFLHYHSDLAFVQSRLSNQGIQHMLENWDSEILIQFNRQKICLLMDKKYLEISLLNKEIESARKPAHKKLLKQYILDLTKLESDALCIDYSALYYHYNLGLSNYLLGNIELSYKSMNRIHSMICLNEYLLKSREDLVLRAMANRVLCAIQLNDVAAVKTNLKELNAISTATVFCNNYKSYLMYVLEVVYFSKTGKYDMGIMKVNNYAPKKEEFVSGISIESFILQENIYETFHYANCLFESGDIRKAIKLMFEFVSLRKNIDKRDAYSAARFFYLILLIELNDDDLIYSELRSVERFLREEAIDFKFEKILLKFIRSLMVKNTTIQIRNHYNNLSNDLMDLKEDSFESNAFTYFDFLSWAQKRSNY